MTNPEQREKIARIIDPEAFRRKDETLAGRNPGWAVEAVQHDCAAALAKADAIIALDPAPESANSGRFAEWSTDTLAAQCRMQARENLDPEYSQFMEAVAARLAYTSSPALDVKAEMPCSACGRSILTQNIPGTGFIATCGNRIAKLADCVPGGCAATLARSSGS